MDANGNSATNSFGFNTMQTNSLWQDVKNYGATGNGTTKDTAAIQAAINACRARRICLAAQRHVSVGHDFFEEQYDALH